MWSGQGTNFQAWSPLHSRDRGLSLCVTKGLPQTLSMGHLVEGEPPSYTPVPITHAVHHWLEQGTGRSAQAESRLRTYLPGWEDLLDVIQVDAIPIFQLPFSTPRPQNTERHWRASLSMSVSLPGCRRCDSAISQDSLLRKGPQRWIPLVLMQHSTEE